MIKQSAVHDRSRRRIDPFLRRSDARHGGRVMRHERSTKKMRQDEDGRVAYERAQAKGRVVTRRHIVERGKAGRGDLGFFSMGDVDAARYLPQVPNQHTYL